MKKLITITILLSYCLVSYGQKPSPQEKPIPDTLPSISIEDIKVAIKELETQITKSEWDKAVSYYQFLANISTQRKSKIKK